jgi:hypothetical protein
MPDRFLGWAPFRVYWQGDEPWIDWCQLGSSALPIRSSGGHRAVHAIRSPYCSAANAIRAVNGTHRSRAWAFRVHFSHVAAARPDLSMFAAVLAMS